MIVKIRFDKDKPFMYFGSTPTGKWHKHLRNYVEKYKLTVHSATCEVTVSDFPSLPDYKWFNDKILLAEFINWGFPIKKIFDESFLDQKLVTKKVNSILTKSRNIK